MFEVSIRLTSLVAWWAELLTTNHKVPGSIPGSTMWVGRECVPLFGTESFVFQFDIQKFKDQDI